MTKTLDNVSNKHDFPDFQNTWYQNKYTLQEGFVQTTQPVLVQKKKIIIYYDR